MSRRDSIIDLNGAWHIRSVDGQFDLRGNTPGSFFYDLEKSGYWGEGGVFYRENNQRCVALASRDFLYERRFCLPDDFWASHQRIYLEAEGLDTLAEIRLNGKPVAQTENMFRRYQFEVRRFLRPGENTISVLFANAVAEAARRQARRPLWNPPHTLDGAVHLRKSHCSFGWDWGPQIPDLGIWRPIRLRAYGGARLADFHVVQKHEAGKVFLQILADLEQWSAGTYSLQVTITDPGLAMKTFEIEANKKRAIAIAQPQFWWPNGYGGQPLYEITCAVKREGEIIEEQSFRLGLRRLKLERIKDEYGETFQFNVNGVAIFARGANYIPEDVYLTRPDRAATERLIAAAAAANFNCLRVWGGGVYPSDDFYDLCDRYGLIVWQDLMFACGVYDVSNPAFYENIKAEVADNLKRIRHHACLGLVCGNNEMEWGLLEWDFPKTEEMRREYLQQYEVLLPQVVAKVCPDIDYWPASPSSGGGFDEPNAENRGDVHYWQVWHGNKPFTEFRRHYFRFLSEFGFESLPSLKTVHAFTAAEDRNIFSPVMEDHQRCEGGNGKILAYLAQHFRYPKDFDSLLYVSQLSQAEAMRCAVEHLRRHRGRCMGATYWQLNDNWPAASWSSIDYYGRWKALHYAAKRMFDQLLVSCEEGETTASIHLSNEHNHAVAGTLTWKLLSQRGDIIRQGECRAQAAALTSSKLIELDFGKELQGEARRERYLSFAFLDQNGGARYGSACFVPYKHLRLLSPALATRVVAGPENFEIHVTASAFAKFVALDLSHDDVVFSDNYFDLDAGQTRIITLAKQQTALHALQSQLIIRSLFDSF